MTTGGHFCVPYKSRVGVLPIYPKLTRHFISYYIHIKKACRIRDFIQKYGKENPFWNALSSGCDDVPYAINRKVTQETVRDVKDMIELIPGSLECNQGRIRIRDSLTPLYIAIYNEDVPLSLVKHMIQRGANWNAKLGFNYLAAPMLPDLESEVPFRTREVRRFIEEHKRSLRQELESTFFSDKVDDQGNPIRKRIEHNGELIEVNEKVNPLAGLGSATSHALCKIINEYLGTSDDDVF
jgi:hypothetical protein